MENLFNTLIENTVTHRIGKELHELWLEHGKPLPSDGPSTSMYGEPCSRMTYAEIDPCADLSQEEAEVLADKYNSILDTLYRVVDVCYIGGGIFHTQYNTNEEFERFSSEACEIIDNFVTYDLWETFCAEYF